MSEKQSTVIDYTDRQRAALGAGTGICRALNPSRTFMCDLDEGHDGDHSGFELPTIEIAEPMREPGPCVDGDCYCRCTWAHGGSCAACLHLIEAKA